MTAPFNLPTWAELFRLTTKATLGVWAVACFFLFFPASRFPIWASVADVQKSNMPIVIGVFIFCTVALAFEAILFVFPLIMVKVKDWKYRRDMKGFLNALTYDEKMIMGVFMSSGERVATFPATVITLQPLINRGIVRVSATGQREHSFELHPVARKYLYENPAIYLTAEELRFIKEKAEKAVEDFIKNPPR
jgi:hypothetical protein